MTLHKYFKIIGLYSYIPTIISKDLCHDYEKNLFWLFQHLYTLNIGQYTHSHFPLRQSSLKDKTKSV